MIDLFLQRALVFGSVFLIFLPFTSKVVRLASTTWDEREHISSERKREVLIIAPFGLLVSFILVFVLVNALVELLVF